MQQEPTAQFEDSNIAVQQVALPKFSLADLSKIDRSLPENTLNEISDRIIFVHSMLSQAWFDKKGGDKLVKLNTCYSASVLLHQQSAEKALKALMYFNRKIGKINKSEKIYNTHDLILIVNYPNYPRFKN